MSDYVIRATAADGQIRAFAATTRDMVEEARRRHDTSPVITAALGRLMTAAVVELVAEEAQKRFPARFLLKRRLPRETRRLRLMAQFAFRRVKRAEGQQLQRLFGRVVELRRLEEQRARPHPGELLGAEGCKTNGFDQFERISFWKTPQAEGGKYVPYSRWTQDYIAIMGGR